MSKTITFRHFKCGLRVQTLFEITVLHLLVFIDMIMVVFLVLLQVFPHVLHVCEFGLCCSNSTQNAQLETTIQVLPLVSFRRARLAVYRGFTCVCTLTFALLRQDSILPRHESLSLAHVHLFLVLCHRCHGDRRLYLQVYRVPRVSGL